ncbi:MAG TPA: IPT/TIG domain-containing protein [Longimicrobium sp.]|nr:IPT/TIG domain-containing protein [Longimicrobium sp.]
MATTVANPGNVVVPLSTILDQLQGKLTGSEIDALLLAVLGGRRQQVNPGDPITADLFNQILRDISDLSVRVAQLEGSTGGGGGGSGTLTITQVLPPGPITAGDFIRIEGTNFGFSVGAHSVFFGTTRAIAFGPASSDTRLDVQVPDPVAGATEAGTPMTLTVGNLNATATRQVTVRARPVVTSGGLSLTYLGSRPPTPAANAPVLYDFELGSFASENLTVTLNPVIQVIPPLPSGVPDPGLPGLTAVLDADGTERGNRQVSLLEGQTKTISVRVNLPNGTNDLRYSLSVGASAPGITAVNETIPPQQVGQLGDQPDATVTTFEAASFVSGIGSVSSDTGGVSGVDGTLSVQRNSTAIVDMRTEFANIANGVTNNYDLSAEVLSPANGWTAGPNSTMPDPLPIVGPEAAVSTFWDLHAPDSTATAVVRLTLTRGGGGSGNTRSVSYRLVTTPP